MVLLDTAMTAPKIKNTSFAAGTAGPDILSYYASVGEDSFFLSAEMHAACLDYPEAKVRGIVPSKSIGSILAFDSASIEAAIKQVSPVPLAPHPFATKGSRTPSTSGAPTLAVAGTAGRGWLTGRRVSGTGVQGRRPAPIGRHVQADTCDRRE